MEINCLLFDLDGTLLNTNKLVVQSFRHTLKKHLNRDVSEMELYPNFGIPLVKIMEQYDLEQVEEMLHTYRSFNLANHDELTTVFPGVNSTLEQLWNKEVKMGVVTSKIRNMALRGLELFDLDRYFDVVVAYEDTEQHKPNGDPITKAMESFPDITEDSVLMIGDSPYDIQCAANAGVRSAAVEWSVHGIEGLKKYQPDMILKEFKDLLDLSIRSK